ncbi:recombinase RecT [Vagococcus sp. PNs007]|uniref:Recombinase RecT n=1 Tax=Vagococcus proximus TaxID=2991417 RepID=A0ABT5X2M5_9ENTE|nr:recombinase RecT [Vagococcus proximus]MDF0480249.1 recombinase RecT [Vagococcus proximus]
MATSKELKANLMKPETEVVPSSQLGLKALLGTPMMKKKFEEVLSDNANSFMASILTLVSNDSYLADAEPMSIMSSAMVAATLNLGLDKNLGYAYLVPFNTKDKVTNKWVKKANFVLGYKGYIQLAQRSGQYKALNVIEVYEGELRNWNRLTEEIEFDPKLKASDDVIGYVGYFELLNGFRKTVYWTKQEIEMHRIANSKDKDKQKKSGVWASDYNAMARKTVLRGLLSKWGILSVDMKTAVINDEGTVSNDDVSLLDIEEPHPIEVTPIKEEVVEQVETKSKSQQALFDDLQLGKVTS